MTVRLNHIKVTGLGLTDDFLLELADRAQTARIKNATAASYSAEPYSLEEAVQDAWDSARKLWAKVPLSSQTGTAQPGWENFVRPLLTRMGYTASFVRPQMSALTPAQQRFPISYLSETGDVPVHFSGAERLDSVTDENGVRISPHGLMQGYLNATPEHLWGLVTNGKTIRLLRDHGQVTRPAYLEFSLDEIMGAEDSRAFRVLWLLLHRSRLKGGTGSLLEDWNEAAKQSGVKARDTLRDGVKGAIEALGTGFLTGNPALLGAVKDGQITPTDLYRACLKLVYQLVFLFVTEDRDLLFARDEDGGYVPDAATRDRARHYLTRALRNRAAVTGSETHADTYEGLKFLLSRVRTGFPDLGLPALGSHLFVPHPLGEIEGQPLTPADLRLSNAALHKAVLALSEISVNGTRRPVNYAGLDSEELGSIYESLLELVPRVNPGPAFALEVLAGNERKTTGSYYTPTPLIDLLLDSALDPVIEDAVAGKPDAEAVAALRALKVIDPACGSGHFLIAAARRIGARLAALEEGTAQPSPEALRKATRSVIAHCIYGADINPLAVELAKVALWLESQDAGKPLAFLDHRLRVGNSLLGTTRELMLEYTKSGKPYFVVPDDAFTPIEGDDKKYASAVKKKNKLERGQPSLLTQVKQNALTAEEFIALGNMPDDTLKQVEEKEKKFNELMDGVQRQNELFTANAWCAAFVWPKYEGAPAPLTTDVLNAMSFNPDDDDYSDVYAEVQKLARQYRFLHPHLEFPDVFTAEQGGFDCVLGNPPWERLKLQEKEWFAQRVPAIAEAPNAAARTRMITELKASHPKIYADFQADLRQAEGESHFIRASGRYPLTGRGDVNTYAIFSEVGRDSLNPGGRMGIIVPTGIATDDTTKFFFQSLMDKKSLASLYDFENREGIFPGVHRSFKFCMLTVSGTDRPNKAARFAFFALNAAEATAPDKVFTLSPDEIALLNPNTRTAPVFRTARDASITKSIYQRVPVLLNEETGQNPWGISFMRMFDVSNDSGLFRTAAQLEAEGWTLDGNRYTLEQAQMLPLYEGRMVHMFDHRFASWTGEDYSSNLNKTVDFVSETQFFVDKSSVPDIFRLELCWTENS
ncbi:N-6 DNA methylase [Deinococcus sp. D7000]|nr:N-6 DNA methylase [Deinococcus sp. D7000]